MKKQLNQGVVIGILVVLGVIVVAWGWKALSPPAPAGIKPFDKASLKVMQEEHSKSAAQIAAEQSKAYEKAHGGGQ